MADSPNFLGFLGRWTAGLRELWAAIGEYESFALAAAVTFIYFMVRPLGPWWAHVPAVLLAVAGLLVPKLGRRPGVWLILAVAVASWVIPAWTFMDNHGYLLVYWCLALFASLAWSDHPAETLATNARIMIGLVFGLAVLWKVVLSPDFMNGEFFRVVFLVDHRFRTFTELAGGMTAKVAQHNQQLIQQLRLGQLGLTSVKLTEPHAQVVLAYVTTWWTALVETTVAVTFLIPRRFRLSKIRDAVLIFFCWFTYPFASVAGFGWLLTVMGVSQVEPERRITRTFYLGTFALILIDKLVPWTQALVNLLH